MAVYDLTLTNNSIFNSSDYGISGSDSTYSGISTVSADNRYVNATGDSMSGSLAIAGTLSVSNAMTCSMLSTSSLSLGSGLNITGSLSVSQNINCSTLTTSNIINSNSINLSVSSTTANYGNNIVIKAGDAVTNGGNIWIDAGSSTQAGNIFLGTLNSNAITIGRNAVNSDIYICEYYGHTDGSHNTKIMNRQYFAGNSGNINT